MSRENVEVMRRLFDLWRSGEFEAWLETMDPSIGWDISTYSLPDVPNLGDGRDAFVTEMFGTYISGWNDYSVNIKELIDAGDDVVVVLHKTATMRGTGVPLDRDLVQLWTVGDGRATFMRVFRTKAEALGAAGLSE